MSNGLEGRGHASVGPLGSIALVRVIAQGDPSACLLHGYI